MQIQKQEMVVAGAKLVPVWIVTVVQQVTSALPSFLLWATALLTILQVYVLVRDRLVRKEETKRRARRHARTRRKVAENDEL